MRNTVNKNFYVFSAETIHSHSHVGTDASTFTYFHTRNLTESIAECLGCICQVQRIHGHSVICRISDFFHLVAHHYHFRQLSGRLQFYVQPDIAAFRNFHTTLRLLESDRRKYNGILAGWRFQMIQTMLISDTGIFRTFQVHYSVINSFTVERHHFTRNHTRIILRNATNTSRY